MNFYDTSEAEYADISVAISGANVVKLQGFAFGVQQDLEYIFGQGRKPLSINGGNKQYPGEISILVGALDDLNRAAQAAGGDDITDVEFDITMNVRPKGQRMLKTIVIPRFRVGQFEERWTQGDKKSIVTLTGLGLDCIIRS